jgi:hypothetical protein
MDPGCQLAPDENRLSEEKAKEYMSAVGSLLYLAIATRPDIAYTVGVLGRYNSKPGVSHWRAVEHLFRYLQGTKDYCLTYSFDNANSSELFLTYSDAAHADDKATFRSTGAYVVTMGGGAISWQSKLQPIVTLSTTEAEYVAATFAGTEIRHLQNVLGELGYDTSAPSTLHMDNQSAIAVSKDPEFHGRMKHIKVKYFWLREAIAAGEFKPKYCPTNEMPADILTKPLTKPKVEDGVRRLGLFRFPNS